MERWIAIFWAWVLLLIPIQAYADFSCAADSSFETLGFSGEVYGQKEFTQIAGPLRLMLVPSKYGWQIQVTKKDGEADMAIVTPPLRMVDTNPRFISGWHFRNKDNTAPNHGEINAPQVLRKIIFGKFTTNPSPNSNLMASPNAPVVPTVEPNPGDHGVGEIIIEDYGLADLEGGQKARMVYMKFSGCLGWNRGHEDVALANTAEPGIPMLAVARMTACDLNPEIFKLSDRMTKGREGGQAAFLTPDMDGDGSPDFVVPIEKRHTNEPGLAICLGHSNRLILAGYNGRIGKHLDPLYFDRVDYWGLHSGPLYGEGAEGTPPPQIQGDGIVMGKEDSSSVLIYLDKNLKVSSYWQGD